jgi:hypothetical protein
MLVTDKIPIIKIFFERVKSEIVKATGQGIIPAETPTRKIFVFFFNFIDSLFL